MWGFSECTQLTSSPQWLHNTLLDSGLWRQKWCTRVSQRDCNWSTKLTSAVLLKGARTLYHAQVIAWNTSPHIQHCKYVTCNIQCQCDKSYCVKSDSWLPNHPNYISQWKMMQHNAWLSSTPAKQHWPRSDGIDGVFFYTHTKLMHEWSVS